MVVSLDWRNLLRKYGQSQGIETERLLNQYNTSLTQNREARPQSFEAMKAWRQTALPNQSLFFNAEEAMKMGINLEEGWLLKMTPFEGGYKSSFITPYKWEITEDDIYISPEGMQYSRADMETLLAVPTGLAERIPTTDLLTIEGLTAEGQRLYEEYQQAGGALDIAEWAEEQQGLYQEYQEEMQGLYQEYQTAGGELDYEGWLDERERQYLETKEIFGLVFPELDVQEVIAYAQTNTEAFLQDIIEIGRTPETEELLRASFEGVTEEWLTELFTPTIGSPELRQNLIDALAPVTETNIDWAVQYFGNNPEQLRHSLIGEGRNEATEKLVRQLWPDITEQQLSDYFNPLSLVVEEKAAEGGKGIKGTFTAGVGDLVANIGGIFKWAGAEGIGEKIIKFGQYMQVQAEPVPFEPDEFTWKQLFNPSFYATYGVRMLPTLMLLVIPAIGAYSLAGSIAARVGLGAVGRAVITGVGGAALSRPIESALEAGGAYDEARARGLSHEEAEQVADEVFKKNLTLAGLDAFQIAVAFMPTPLGKAAAGAVTRGLVRTATIGGKLFFTGLTEGGEEVYQEMVLKKAMGDERGLAEMLEDPDMQLVFSLGAIAGLGMGAGGDIIVRIQNRIIPQLTPEQKAQFDGDKADFISQGLSEDVATQKALDNVVEQNPELEKVVEDAAKTVDKEITFEQIKPKTEAEAVVVEHMKQQIVPEEVTPIIPKVTKPTAEVGMPRVEFRGITTNIGKGYEILQEGNVVGTVSYGTTEAFGTEGMIIGRIDIAESARRQGFATQAIQKVLTEAEAAGVPLYTGILEADGVKLFNALEEHGVIKLTPADQKMLGDVITRGMPTAEAGMPEAPKVSGLDAIIAEEDMERLMGKYLGLDIDIRRKEGRWLASARDGTTGEHFAIIPAASKEEAIARLENKIAAYYEVLESGKVKEIPETPIGMPEVIPETVETKTRQQLEGLGRMYQEWWSKRRTADETKVALARFVRETLPMDVRGKFVTAVAKVKTDAELTTVMTKVMELAESNAQKVLKAEVRAELKKARAKIKDHILKGKFTPETQRLLDVLNHNLELDRDTAREKIVTNIKAYEAGELSYEEMFKANEALNFAGIDGMSSEELINLLDYIKNLEAIGRSERQAKWEIATEKIKAIRADISNILTGGKGLKTGIGAVSGKQLAAKPGWLDTFVNWQYGIDNLADKLSKFDTTSEPYQSVISKFVSQVHRATNRQFIGTKEAYSKIKDAVSDVFGVKGGRAINQVLNGLDEEVNLGTFELTAEYIANHPEATTVTIKMTRNEMLAKYMQMQDSTLNDTFTTGMGWSAEVRSAIESNLTAEEKKLVDVFFQFYEDYYNTINPIYQELYNVDMPHNPRYSPIRRDFEGDVIESVLTFQDAAQYASVLNGSLKARQKNIRPLRFNGATQILSNHIEQMEHFKAWAIIMRDMRRVFGNTEIRQAIEQYHGRGIIQLIDTFMNQMARGGIDTATTNRIADWLRRNFTRSILAIKPVIALKQIPSLFAYVSDQEMGVSGFVSGIADFWKSPIAHFQFLYKNSEGFRARIQAGFERDIAAALAQHGNKEIAGRGSIKNWFMLQIRLGDTFAVTQGMWAKYKDGLSRGLSQTEAIAIAEDLTNRTQPSFGIDTLSAIQNGGSWLKLMTMFQNQPNKYFRLIGDNLRNFKYGRGSRAKASGTILLAWVILPMMFQFIADAFQWKPERQARAGILGPLNFILIGGQLVQSIWGWLTDQPFDYQVSPVAQTADDLRNIFLKAKKLIGQGQDPYKDISLDDVAALVEYLAKAAGQVTGWPTPYLVQVEKGIRTKLQEGEDINIKDFLFSQWALQPPAKNAEQKVEDLNLKLGEIKEGQEDKPLSEQELNLYTTIDWFRDIGNVYSNVLPQDILDNPNASKESIAWAEYEIAHSKADILPNIPLYKINTEDNDDTIVQYYQQWKARERITSLAQLREFDTLYPKAYLGNVTRQQYELLVKYLESDDKDAFLENHPELRVNPRDEWLKANPIDNARLALAGQAKLLTIEAYNQFKGLLETLDIPTDAIPPMTLPPEGSVENYFKYGELGEEYGWNSWETKLLLLEDDRLREWLEREPIDDHIEALRLQIKHRDLIEEYEGYGDRESAYYIENKDAREEARELFRENHPEWVVDMNRVDAYSLDFPDEQIENYVEYYNLPDKGYRRERYLLENVDFYNSMIDLKDIVPFDADYKVPDARYDELYEQHQDLFEEYENVTGTESERADKREQILGRNPEFARAKREREGYYQFRSITGDRLHSLVQDYANYYLIEKKEGVNYSAGWYEDDWFLMEHPEFYQAMLELYRTSDGKDGWKEFDNDGKPIRDFSKVPTREVYALYQSYLALPVGYARTTFRTEHPELDDWLVLAKGYKPIGDRGGTKPSVWEEILPWLKHRESQPS